VLVFLAALLSQQPNEDSCLFRTLPAPRHACFKKDGIQGLPRKTQVSAGGYQAYKGTRFAGEKQKHYRARQMEWIPAFIGKYREDETVTGEDRTWKSL